MEIIINYNTILHNHILKKLFSRTFTHPDFQGKIDFVSTKWLLTLANPEPSPQTDLGNWDNIDELVDFSTLYKNIETIGMRDPFIIGVGRNTRKIRLEAGNHRVYTMLEHNILYVPAVAYIGDTSITYLGNGKHEGIDAELNITKNSGLLGPYSEKFYAQPLSIIKNCPAVIFNGW